jgi:hypothetical protein
LDTIREKPEKKKFRLRIAHRYIKKRYIAAFSVTLMIIFDIIFQDSAGYLNAWFLIVETIDTIFGSSLLDDSHKFIFYQDNLGIGALPFTWLLFILFHYLLALVVKSFYEIGHSFYLNIRGTAEKIIAEET